MRGASSATLRWTTTALTLEQAYVLALIAESPRRVRLERTSPEEDFVRAVEVKQLDLRGLVEVRNEAGMAVAYVTRAGVEARRGRAH